MTRVFVIRTLSRGEERGFPGPASRPFASLLDRWGPRPESAGRCGPGLLAELGLRVTVVVSEDFSVAARVTTQKGRVAEESAPRNCRQVDSGWLALHHVPLVLLLVRQRLLNSFQF